MMNNAPTPNERCRWPQLPPRTDRALRAAVQFVLERFEVDGVIAAGTHISGIPDERSDLDIYVIHAQPQRQRIQRWFEGIPTEIFVNPPSSIRSYFVDEVDRPSTAHMLAGGFVVLDRAPVVEELRREAQEWLHRPLNKTDLQLTVARYFAADGFDNARDVHERNPATATRILNGVVDSMLDYAFLARGCRLPRTKAYLDELSKMDSRLGELALHYYLAQDVDDRFALAEEIARHTIGESGFFEWESPLETVTSPQTATPTSANIDQ